MKASPRNLHSPPRSLPCVCTLWCGTLERRLIRVIITCTEICLSSHSHFMFLPLDLLTLFNSWYYTTHTHTHSSCWGSFFLQTCHHCLLSEECALLYLFISEKDWGWCTGTTQRDGMGREEGGGFRMGNTCIPVADSFWYLAKLIQLCKVQK